MWTIAIILLIISFILLLLSYFKKDNDSNLQEDIEEISLELYQENVKIKERLAQIERELDIQSAVMSNRQSISSTTENQAIKLYTQGTTEVDIAESLNLSKETVSDIINRYISEGTK